MNDQPRDFGFGSGTDFMVLDAALADLAGALEIGPTPDIAAAVGRRLAVRGRAETQGTAARGRRPWPWRPLPRALAIALLVLLILAGLAAAAIGFGLPGLRIVFVGPSPSPSSLETPAPATSSPTAAGVPGSGSSSPATPAPSASATHVVLGAATTLAAARQAMDYGLYVPSAGIVGSAAPNVFLDTGVPDGLVSLVYPPDPGGPAPSPLSVDGSGRLIGLVITESRGSIEEGYLQKNIGPGTTVQKVVVNGRAGWWIAGRPHILFTVDANGQPLRETLRDIGDVLVWVEGGTLIRIESPRGLAETLRIAESMN
jgi:hypothetical protein